MRHLLALRLVATGLAAIPAPVLAQPGSGERFAERIVMTSPNPGASGISDSDRAIAGPRSHATHERRQRWLERELATAFVTQALGPANPDALATPEPPPRPVPTSAIAVPRWMAPTATLATSREYAARCHTEYRPSSLLGASAEARRRAHFALVRALACEHGLPVSLFDALIIQESAYAPQASSPKRAYGLTQLMAGTARELGVDRYDIADNVRGGARYLRQQVERFGRFDLALAAYNAGPARVKGGRIPAIAETQAYVRRVLSHWAHLEGLPSGRAAARPRVGVRHPF